jgi:membrane protein implicated in regulation of membrane protease activity
LLDLIDLVQPWTWLALGLVLCLAEIFVGTFYLFFFGIAVSSNTLWDHLGFSPGAQIILVCATTFFGMYCARRFATPKTVGVPEMQMEKLEGLQGHVLWVDPEMPRHGRGGVKGRGEWLIRSENSHLVAGCDFRVKSVEGPVLIVELQPQ